MCHTLYDLFNFQHISMYLNGFEAVQKLYFDVISINFNVFQHSWYLFIFFVFPVGGTRSQIGLTGILARPPLASESQASRHRSSVCRPPTPSRELASERRPPAIRSNAPARGLPTISAPGTSPARRKPVRWRAPGEAPSQYFNIYVIMLHISNFFISVKIC
jgi:hypothetical protein